MNINKIKFLVIDDSAQVCDFISRILKKNGASKILTAINGRDAFDILKQEIERGDPVQFVFCDWNMPVMSGLGFLKMVRSNDDETISNLPFVMVTVNSEQDQVVEALVVGADNYILKPIDAGTLVSKIQDTWKKRHKAS